MIKEAYVSFEVAKLLKEKEFNERSAASYDSEGQLQEGSAYWNKTPIWYAAPTHQMTVAWLREKGIHMSIDTVISSSGNIYFNIDTYSEALGWNHPVDFYDSYEEAVEAALKYVLENLI